MEKKSKKVNKTKESSKKTNKKTRKYSITKICIELVILLILLGGLLICLLGRKWVKNGNVISKGNVSYEIGDYYEYDETLNGEYLNILDVKWKVMGVDEKGNLLIVSTSGIGELTLGSNDDFGESLDDYLTGIDEMNAMTKAYAKGKDAVYARSVNLADIFQVFNLGLDIVPDYDKISYSWGENKEILYKKIDTTSEDLKFIEGTSTVKHDGLFVMFDQVKNEWVLSYRINYNDKEDKTIGVLKGNQIMFNRYRYDDKIGDYDYLYPSDTKEYNMMCKDERSHSNSYWLADRYILANENYANYGFNSFKSDSVNSDYVVNSVGKTRETSHPVRVVVAIK